MAEGESSSLPLLPQERPEGKLSGSLDINPVHVHHGWLGKPRPASAIHHSKGALTPCAGLEAHSYRHLPLIQRSAADTCRQVRALGLVLAVIQAWVPVLFLPTETSGTVCPCLNPFRDQALMPGCCCLLPQMDFITSSGAKAEEHLIAESQQAIVEGTPFFHLSVPPSRQAREDAPVLSPEPTLACSLWEMSLGRGRQVSSCSARLELLGYSRLLLPKALLLKSHRCK